MHWFFLFVVVLNPILILWALFIWYRAPHLQRKWLWLVFILVGVCQASMNWTSGQTQVSPGTVLFFASGFQRVSDYFPWILQISIPLGALCFLARAWNARKQRI